MNYQGASSSGTPNISPTFDLFLQPPQAKQPLTSRLQPSLGAPGLGGPSSQESGLNLLSRQRIVGGAPLSGSASQAIIKFDSVFRVKRQSLAGNSPQMMAVTSNHQAQGRKANAYMGYMQLQSVQQSQPLGHQASSARQRAGLNGSQMDNSAIENSSGIAGIGVNLQSLTTDKSKAANPNKLRIGQAKKKKQKQSIQTHRELLNTEGLILPERPEAFNLDDNALDQYLVPNTNKVRQQYSIEQLQLGSPQVSNRSNTKAAQLQKAYQGGAQNIQTIIKMLKQNQGNLFNDSRQALSQPWGANQTSRSTNFGRPGALITQSKPLKKTIKKISSIKRPSESSQQRPIEQSPEARVNLKQHQKNNSRREVTSRLTLSQSPPNFTVNALSSSGGHSQVLSSRNIEGQCTKNHRVGTLVRAKSVSQDIEEVQEETTPIGQERLVGERSLSIGKRPSLPEHFMMIPSKISLKTSDIKQKTKALSLKRDLSITNLNQVVLRSQSNLSALQESGSAETLRETHKLSTTQRSIRIYRNAVRQIGSNNNTSLSQHQRSGVGLSDSRRENSQLSQTANQDQQLQLVTTKSFSRGRRIAPIIPNNREQSDLAHLTEEDENFGTDNSRSHINKVKKAVIQQRQFIDRTINTATSQFVSPKTIASQISKTSLNGVNGVITINQPVQFFNYSQRTMHSPFSQTQPIMKEANQINGNKVLIDRVIIQIILRQYFKLWKRVNDRILFNLKRKELFQNLALGSENPMVVKQQLNIIAGLSSLDQFSFFEMLRKNISEPLDVLKKIVASESLTLNEIFDSLSQNISTMSKLSSSCPHQKNLSCLLRASISCLITRHFSPSHPDQITLFISFDSGNTLKVSPSTSHTFDILQYTLNLFQQAVQSNFSSLLQILGIEPSSYQKILKPVAHFDIQGDIRNTEAFIKDLQSFKIADSLSSNREKEQEAYRALKETSQRLEQVQEVISFRYVKIDCSAFKTELRTLIRKRMMEIEQSLVQRLESDTTSLRHDLTHAVQTLSQQHQGQHLGKEVSINLYLEQLNLLKVFSSENLMHQLYLRLSEVKGLLSILDENSIIGNQIKLNIKDLETKLESLTVLKKACTERLQVQKPMVEQQFYKGCLALSQKMKIFEEKYKERYLSGWAGMVRSLRDLQTGAGSSSSLHAHASAVSSMLEELKTRERMITDISAKCQAYKDCLTFLEPLSDTKFKEARTAVTCFEDVEGLRSLSRECQEAWQTYDKLVCSVYQVVAKQSFLSLDLNSIEKEVRKILNRDDKAKEPELEKLRLFVRRQARELEGIISDLKTLQVIPQYFWSIIFELNGCAENMKEDFTLLELIKIKVTGKSPEVKQVLDLQRTDCMHRQIIDRMKSYYSKERPLILKLSTVPMTEVTILSEFDCLSELFDEGAIELKKIISSTTSLLLRDEAKKEIIIVQQLQDLVRTMQETQKQLFSLEAAFNYMPLQEIQSNNFQTFQELKSLYQVSIGLVLKQYPVLSTLFDNLNPWAKALSSLSKDLGNLLKSLDDYFEAKRVRFPRFFFMTDFECLTFLQSVERAPTEWKSISLLFPGASSFQIENNSIAGLTSTYKELLKFKKPVKILDSDDISQTLCNVEFSMQQTIGTLISEAVASFPRQSLDEWVLDYPLQTILTTIHLILTHEINELFESMTKRQAEAFLGQSPGELFGKGIQEDSRLLEDFDDENINEERSGRKMISPRNQEAIHNNFNQMLQQNMADIFWTPDTRDLLVATVSSAPQGLRRIGGGHQRTISVQELGLPQKRVAHNRNMSCQIFHNAPYGSSIKACNVFHQPNEMIQSQPIDDERDSEWEAFRRDMFGSDFELAEDEDQPRRMKHLDLQKRDRDTTMLVLQEKSFQGLFLRLQFWINQICKSLRGSRTQLEEGQGQKLHICFSHHKVQRSVMQTIVNFLSYMKDVVYDLKVKGTQCISDFEWQKQIRLTWQGAQEDETRGCRVDCGAWTTYQANEYLGNCLQRLPVTPLTNKYFVFISAALREKSAVLFRCMPTHDYSLDVFSEFSNICATPLQTFHCAHPKIPMKSLMQFLNGAALASTWIFFEFVDKLDQLHLQAFSKEIQMVQQQFIIAELSQENEEQEEQQEEAQVSLKGGARSPSISMGLKKGQMEHKESRGTSKCYRAQSFTLEGRQEESQEYYQEQPYYKELPSIGNKSPQTLPKPSTNRSIRQGNTTQQHKVCFGVFASFSHRFVIKQEKWAHDVSTSLQSAFRVLSLTRPQFPLLAALMFKSEGFLHFDALSTSLNDVFLRVQDKLLMASTSLLNERDDWFALTLRDLRSITQVCGSLKESRSPFPAERKKQIEYSVV